MTGLELPVAKGRGGRPKKSEGEKGTRHVRVFEDLADMIGWIYHFENLAGRATSIAQILDPILRDDIVELYAPYKERAEAIMKLEKPVAPQSEVKPKKPKKP